jgi:hypothetical protein
MHILFQEVIRKLDPFPHREGFSLKKLITLILRIVQDKKSKIKDYMTNIWSIDQMLSPMIKSLHSKLKPSPKNFAW